MVPVGFNRSKGLQALIAIVPIGGMVRQNEPMGDASRQGDMKVHSLTPETLGYEHNYSVR
jgi:hypothetical protein